MSGSGRSVVVTGVGVVSPVGDSFDALADALAAGRSGISEITAFETGDRSRLGGEIRGFDPRRYLGDANFRPLDRTGRLATVAVGSTLNDGGWRPSAEERDRELGLVLGTMFGSLHTISAFDRRALEAGPRYAKPLDFANSVINAAAGQAAIWHHLTGTNATIGGGTTAGLQALGYAADQIRSGRADALLAGGAEELCLEALLGFAGGGFLADEDGRPGAGVPFHPDSEGFFPGEGAGFLLLEAEEAARFRGARILAEIRGHATAFDPGRGRDPEERSRAVGRAVEASLERAGAEAGSIAFVSASANGHPAVDRTEARGVEMSLGARARTVPVMAVKALVGECLGAAGALQALAALGVFATRRLPGIPGLEGIDRDLPLPGIRARTRSVSGRTALVTAVGLDGAASALVLAGREDFGSLLS